jgi:hypothetical protein
MTSKHGSVIECMTKIEDALQKHDIYRENYDILMELPIVKKLMRKNDKLKSKLKKYKTIVEELTYKLDGIKQRHSRDSVCLIPNKTTVSSYSSDIENMKLPNIVYELIDSTDDELEIDHKKDENDAVLEEINNLVTVENIKINEKEEDMKEEETKDVNDEMMKVEKQIVGEVEEGEVEEGEVEEGEVEEDEEGEEEEAVEDDGEEHEEAVEEVEAVEDDREEDEEEEAMEEAMEEVEEEVEEEEVEEEEVVEKDDTEVQNVVHEEESGVEEGEEEEVEVDDEEEEMEEEVSEVVINGKKYYTTNETNGVIYNMTSDDEIGDEVGVFKDGKPVFSST